MPPSVPQEGQDNAKALRDSLSALRSAGTVAVQPQNSLAAVVQDQKEAALPSATLPNARASIVREMRAQEHDTLTEEAPNAFAAQKPAPARKISKQNLNEPEAKPWTLFAAIAAIVVLAAAAWFFLRPDSSSTSEANGNVPGQAEPVVDPVTDVRGPADGGEGTDGTANPGTDDTGTETDPGETDPGETDPEGSTDGVDEEVEFPVGPAITPEELRNAPTSESYVAGGTLVLEGVAPTQESIDELVATAADALGGANVVANMTVDPSAETPNLTTIHVRGTVNSLADFSDLLLETQTLLLNQPDSELRVIATPGSDSINVANRTDAILQFFAGSGVDPERLTSNVLVAGDDNSTDDFQFLITNLLPQ